MVLVRLTFIALVSALVPACSRGAQVPRTQAMAPITATAPKGIDDRILGAPVDVHFRTLLGPAGRPLFSESRVRRNPQTYVSHDALTMDDMLSLEANMSAWKVNAQGSYGTQNRYGSYRAFQVVGISSVDDTDDMLDEPPSEAVFYVSKVYWGHSYEAVFEGNGRNFGAGLGVELGKFNVGMRTFADSHQLNIHFVGSGLTPKTGDGLFAQSPEQVMSAYTVSSAPVPILVEYRLIPRRPAPRNVAFALPIHVTVRFRDLRIQDDDTWIGRTTWNLQAACAADGQAAQERPVQLINTSVKEGEPTTLNQTLSFSATPGDFIECTAQGFESNNPTKTIALGTSQRFQISAGGTYRLIIHGAGRVTYEIDADVEAQAMGR